MYVLSELTGTVTTFSLNSDTGLLTEVSSASGLPPESKLVPGAPRGPVGAPGGPPPRNTSSASATSSELPTEHQPRGFAIDPKGRFLVVSGEKSNTISAYAIDEASGAVKLIGKYPAGKGANWVEIVSFD